MKNFKNICIDILFSRTCFICVFLLCSIFRLVPIVDAFVFPSIIYPYAAIIFYKYNIHHIGQATPKALVAVPIVYFALSIYHIFFRGASTAATYDVLVHLLILIYIFHRNTNHALAMHKEFLCIAKWAIYSMVPVVAFSVWLFINQQFYADVFGLQGISLGYQSYYSRLYVFMHPNGSAMLLLICLYFTFFVQANSARKYLLLHIPMVMLFALALFFTQSRTVILAGLVSAFLWCIIWLIQHKNIKKHLHTAIWLPLVFSLVIVTITACAEHTKSIELRSFTEGLSSFSNRIDIWKAIIQAFAAKPMALLTGTLTDGLYGFFKDYLFFEISSAHNAWLEILLIGGVVSLLLFVITIAQSFITILRNFKKCMANKGFSFIFVLLVALLICSLMESVLLYSVSISNAIFFLCLGYCYTIAKQSI